MARSWGELLGEPDAVPAREEESEGRFFSRLRDSLSKSRRALTGELVAAASFDPGNDADWERLEEALIAGDVGVRATAELVRRLEARGELADLNTALAEEVTGLFGEPPVLDVAHEPAVILVVGVNGTGKTTTIGKLALQFREEGRRAVLVAGDTFRAAAVEQLQIWGERVGAPVIAGGKNADAAGLAFEALTRAKAEAADVLLI
ncbi:MAG TPA: signal recognition particle receptor subunit alpha, partial [Gaiellaceae bacterium]